MSNKNLETKPRSVSLYEMAAAYNAAFEGLRERLSDDDAEQAAIEEALVAELDAIEGTMEVKLANVAKFMLNLDWEADGLANRINALKARQKSLMNASERLRSLMEVACSTTGRDKWEVGGVVISRVKNSQPSVAVESVAALPRDLVKVVVTETPDKKAILEHVKAGGQIPDGVTILHGYHVRVKEV